MKKVIYAVACLILAGCANLKFQWSASYATDNLVADIEAAHKKETK